MQLLWIQLAAFFAALIAAISAREDAPLAAGLMVGASFYLIGFTVLGIAGAFDTSTRVRRIFGAVMLALGSISVGAALLITALKTYARYIPL